MIHTFMRFPEGKAKAVTFSYDDGCKQDIKTAETLQKYGIKGTFNICSKRMDNDNWYLTSKEIKEHIIARGHEIAVHGAEHQAPGSVSLIDGIRDVLDGRIGLEQTFGGIIKGMAYPNSGIRIFDNGATYEEVRSYVKQLGISYARTLGGDNNGFLMPEDWYKWMPTAHHNNPQIFDWIDEFLKIDFGSLYVGGQRPRLFYIWGHSHEFDRDKNWEKLTDICEKISGKEDIWYATNIEIYNYTMAYRALEFNAEGTLVYNPTLYTIWFYADKKDYCIKSGETIEL